MKIELSDPVTVATAARIKKVLNAGSGVEGPASGHSLFRSGGWQTVRLDIDPSVEPDILGSFVEIATLAPPSSFDAIFSSHSMEHLFAHEVLPALRGFHQVLRPDGFVVITCPDLEILLPHLIKNGLDTIVYESPAGPIAGLDMLFGHTASIAQGKTYMAHKTAFTTARLGNFLIQAGFTNAFVDRRGWDLWAIGMREHADRDEIRREMVAGGLTLAL